MRNIPTILAISGSTRKNSSNERILRFLAERFEAKACVELFTELDQLPHFNPDLDVEPFPAEVVRLREKIQSADALLICTPEYVFSLPGALKNALEWMVSTVILTDKPTGFIVASASGVKAYEALDLVLTTIQCKIHPDARLLINGARGKVTEKGIEDAGAAKELDGCMNALLESINPS